MEAKKQVEEETYEVSLDSHDCCDGPKTRRPRASDNAPKLLFNGLVFISVGTFGQLTRKNSKLLLKLQVVVARSNATHATSSTTLVVHNLDPPHWCQPGEGGSFAAQRLEKANEIGCKVIGHTWWLLESIAACKLRWNM
ncbi:BRCA1-associated RING domain protein 1-like [Cornus florida]|uniref:BRCA1-associated RING domain protein 1-like n=1 Tax=Cornus florida TaxID=4283 RepID=UPI00289EB912|nr:BRCA1-associated RING domain protein 1-like [Cornus florida]XP_059625209.1 BRCA1-associated RING domain protein 1-like [Cornus florida]